MPSAPSRPAQPSLTSLLASGGYHSYAYSYPHKTAYRELTPGRGLRDVWANEPRDALFLYLHVPFCEQRCGFCNLFTQAQPRAGLDEQYVAALERQALVLSSLLAPATFAQLAIGGGTPTFLSAPLLDRVFRVARSLGARRIPTAIEISPSTFDEEKLSVLVSHGTTRVSMGVQSFESSETDALKRRQDPRQVERAFALVRDVIPVRNLDLIYGIPGQTADSLRGSIDRALSLGANEIYLYPLYVRPLTVLGRKGAPEDSRLSLYRTGRDHLRTRGFTQVSMRMFAAPSSAESSDGPVRRYRCQEDGMVGLGAGARSYTRALHYASPYAVRQSEVRARIVSWSEQSDAAFAVTRHGFALSEREQQRRFVLLSLLDCGLDRAAYRARFGDDVLAHLPTLSEALESGLATLDDRWLHLTERGVERSDVLGHWLQSPEVSEARAAWVPV